MPSYYKEHEAAHSPSSAPEVLLHSPTALQSLCVEKETAAVSLSAHHLLFWHSVSAYQALRQDYQEHLIFQQLDDICSTLLHYPDLNLHDQAISRSPTRFPYIPGYLSFRELPAVLQALDRLTVTPDLLLCDGQGLAHQRRFGLACHLGVLTDIPSIGVAKSRLIGTHDEPPKEKGQWVPLTDKGETIGAVLCTRNKVSPVYISLGHRISLPTAIDYVLACTTRFRLPETTRWAHRLASA